MNAALKRAATGVTDAALNLAPLPAGVTALLVDVSAPPRLAAHLRAVHDVATKLLVGLAALWPVLTVDRAAVAFGAATHDIGKALHPSELVGPGSRHEDDGLQLLLGRDVAPELARFARTHARWDDPDATLEDQLVALADKVWKGRREALLEQRIVDRIAEISSAPRWDVFMGLDELLERLAADADARLAFQASFGATATP